MAIQTHDPSQAIVSSAGSANAGGATNNTMPVITGTADPGDTVLIFDRVLLLGSALVAADGTWSFTPGASLKEGRHQFAAIPMDSEGNCGVISAAFVVTVDTSTPAAPALTGVTDGSSGNLLIAGATIADPRPMLGGTGTAGDIVTLYDGTNVIGTTIVGANGTWSLAPAYDLSNGLHAVHVTQTNAAGTSSVASADFQFMVNSTGLAAPVITTLVEFDVNHVFVANVPSGATSPYSSLQIEGTSVPGAIIDVYDGANRIGSAVTESNGTWAFYMNKLGNGIHDLSVTQANAAGTESPASNHFTVVVANTGPQPPDIISFVQFSSATGYQMGSAIPLAQLGVVSPYLNIEGRGEPGDRVRIYDGSTLIGSVTINSKGSWEFVAPDFSLGSHSVSVTQTNSSGTTSAKSSAVSFTVALVTQLGTGTGAQGVSDSPVDGSPGDNTDTARIAPPQPPVVSGATHMSLGASENPVAGDSPSPVAHDPAPAAAQPAIISGAPHVSLGATANPAASDSPDPVAADPAPPHTILGEHEAFVGTAGSSQIVDLNADPASYFHETTAHIQGAKGGAINTLHLLGDHQVLDLTSLTGQTSAAKVSGIEVIDLGGRLNALKLSLVDVLNLGEQDLFQADGKQQLMVQGASGDTVDLSNTHVAGVVDGQWHQEGTADVGGVMYNVYEHSGAHTELLVQQGVQIALHN